MYNFHWCQAHDDKLASLTKSALVKYNSLTHDFYILNLRKFPISRDNFVYASSQWETTLQCNVVSHWLGAYRKGINSSLPVSEPGAHSEKALPACGTLHRSSQTEECVMLHRTLPQVLARSLAQQPEHKWVLLLPTMLVILHYHQGKFLLFKVQLRNFWPEIKKKSDWRERSLMIIFHVTLHQTWSFGWCESRNV